MIEIICIYDLHKYRMPMFYYGNGVRSVFGCKSFILDHNWLQTSCDITDPAGRYTS